MRWSSACWPDDRTCTGLTVGARYTAGWSRSASFFAGDIKPLDILARADAAQAGERLHVRLARHGLAGFPVVDRLRADLGQLAVFGRRQAQLLAMGLQA